MTTPTDILDRAIELRPDYLVAVLNKRHVVQRGGTLFTSYELTVECSGDGGFRLSAPSLDVLREKLDKMTQNQTQQNAG